MQCVALSPVLSMAGVDNVLTCAAYVYACIIHMGLSACLLEAESKTAGNWHDGKVFYIVSLATIAPVQILTY